MRVAIAGHLAAAVAFAIMSSGAAQAAQKSGVVVAVTQLATVDGPAGPRTMIADGPVYQGDVIRTGKSGQVQILLLDNTKLVVGPNSYMTVDSFVFEGGGKAGKVSLNAVRGAFRFITGASRKDAYEITTPTATIGVRGTQFDFSIGRRGQMALALFEGEATMCRKFRQQCITVSGTCSVAVAQRFRPVRKPASPEEEANLLANAFPFVRSQEGLRASFTVDTSGCSVERAGVPRAGGGPAPAGFNSAASGFSSFGPVAGPAAVSGTGQGNNGYGNGGEGNEGSTETGNPGQGGGPH